MTEEQHESLPNPYVTSYYTDDENNNDNNHFIRSLHLTDLFRTMGLRKYILHRIITHDVFKVFVTIDLLLQIYSPSP